METFGCQMNVLDSQLVKGQLAGMGYRFTDDWKQADVVLYNTCSVREQAENKAYSRLGLVGQRKKTHPDIVCGVIGCMAERDGLDLFRRYPQVDLLCGPGELDKVPMLIDNVVRTRMSVQVKALKSLDLHAGSMRNTETPRDASAPRASQPTISWRDKEEFSALQGNTHRRSSTLAAAEDTLELLDLSRSFSPDEFQGAAYVRITRGCNKFCTYCVVPNTRGREVHRSPDAIVEECRKLVEAGVIEITLLGQTVNHYHFNHDAAVTLNGIEQPQVGEVVTAKAQGLPAKAQGLPSKAQGLPSLGFGRVTTFAQLLARIHDEIPALQRLRFVTSFPRDFGDDILHTIAARPRICRYLHLPVQSGSNRILKLMNRGYTVQEYRALLDRIRAIVPDALIASDLICGFPTETDEDHRATCDLLRDARFKNCFIFKYSPRPGTTAIDRFTDDVPDEVKRARNNELLRIQATNSDAIHRGYVGKTVRVFVESISEKAQRQEKAEAIQEQQREREARKLSLVVAGQRSAPDAACDSACDSTPPAPTAMASSAPTAMAPSATLAPLPPSTQTTQLTGRTDGDLIVMFDGDASLIGTLAEVKIEKHAPLALFGRLA